MTAKGWIKYSRPTI